jgi:hypothetical protein
MTKKEFFEHLNCSGTSGIFNTCKKIGGFGGIKIAMVGWHNDPWKVIQDNETFEDACNRQHACLAVFHTREELYQAYKSLIKLL